MRVGLAVCSLSFTVAVSARAPLVLLTDFGTQDGAVSAMKGVAYSVSQELLVSDMSHDNPNIFTGAYRLYQAEQFWPKGTVFVAVATPRPTRSIPDPIGPSKSAPRLIKRR